MTLVPILILIAVLLAALAVWLHHLFEGEWLPSDLLREWRLSRVTLEDLDARWAGARDRSDIIVSLTTTPSRIALIEPALKSLLDQTRPPARIELNVPKVSRREQVPYVIPESLSRLRALHIRRCEDLGPATKLIPTLADTDPDAAILVVDDDRIYPRWLIRRYEQAAAARPDAILSMAGWVAPEDLTDRMTTIRSNLLMLPPAPIRAPRLSRPREVDVVQGVMSYLVRGRFFDLAEMQDFSTGPEALRYVDDVRTSAMARVGKWVIPAPSLSFVPWSQAKALQATRLGLINRMPGESHNRNNTIALKHFADRWRVGGPPSGSRT